MIKVQRDFEELPSTAFRPLRDSLNVSWYLSYNIFELIRECLLACGELLISAGNDRTDVWICTILHTFAKALLSWLF